MFAPVCFCSVFAPGRSARHESHTYTHTHTLTHTHTHTMLIELDVFCILHDQEGDGGSEVNVLRGKMQEVPDFHYWCLLSALTYFPSLSLSLSLSLQSHTCFHTHTHTLTHTH